VYTGDRADARAFAVCEGKIIRDSYAARQPLSIYRQSEEENSKGRTEEDLGRYCSRGVESAKCCESRREAVMLNLHTASAVR
jgi:hypothetical protein